MLVNRRQVKKVEFVNIKGSGVANNDATLILMKSLLKAKGKRAETLDL